MEKITENTAGRVPVALPKRFTRELRGMGKILMDLRRYTQAYEKNGVRVKERSRKTMKRAGQGAILDADRCPHIKNQHA